MSLIRHESSAEQASSPLHQLVHDRLLKRIQESEYPTGSKLPSHDELGKEFNVSRPTVIRALSDLAKEGHIQSRKGSGNYVIFTPSGRTKIGLIIPGVIHHGMESIFAGIIRHITNEAVRIGWQILIDSSTLPAEDNALNRPVELARQMIATGITAAVIMPHPFDGSGDALNRNMISEFRSADITLVLLDRDVVNFPGRSDFDLVSMDNVHAGQLIGRHLVKQGSKKALFVSSAPHIATQQLRYQGVCLGFEKSGLEPEFVRSDESFDTDFVRDLIRKRKPDSIVGDSDDTACRILDCLHRLGLRVPQDIMVAGFDDSPNSRLFRIPLTTVAQPVEALAFKAVETLYDRIKRKDLAPCTVAVQGRLHVRLSTGG